MNRLTRHIFAAVVGLVFAGLPGIALLAQLSPSSPFFTAAVLKPAAGGPASPTPELLWLKCNEGSGTTLGDDSTRSTNDLTLSTASFWASVGGFTVPQGASGRYANNVSLNAETDFLTVSFWLYDSGFSSLEILFECASTPTSTSPSWFVWMQSGTIEGGIYHGGGYRYETASSPSVDTWHHIVMTFDNTTSAGDVRIWIDGSEQSTTTVLNTKVGTGNFVNSQLWAWARTGPNSSADSAMDDIRIYSGDKSSSVSAIYGDRQ